MEVRETLFDNKFSFWENTISLEQIFEMPHDDHLLSDRQWNTFGSEVKQMITIESLDGSTMTCRDLASMDIEFGNCIEMRFFP